MRWESIWFGLMVFNVTFNNISVISWRSVLLMEETGVPGENHRPGEGDNKHQTAVNSFFWQHGVGSFPI
jgi:hypothetical protein